MYYVVYPGTDFTLYSEELTLDTITCCQFSNFLRHTYYNSSYCLLVTDRNVAFMPETWTLQRTQQTQTQDRAENISVLTGDNSNSPSQRPQAMSNG